MKKGKKKKKIKRKGEACLFGVVDSECPKWEVPTMANGSVGRRD